METRSLVGYLQVSIFQQCQDLGGHMVNMSKWKAIPYDADLSSKVVLVPLIGGIGDI